MMLQAHKTADWRIVCTLIVFKSAMAPLGAALLVALPKHLLEFITGCVMVGIAETNVVQVFPLTCLPTATSRHYLR